MTIEELTVANETFDVVLGLSILHLLEDKQKAIAKVYKMLKPGVIFITSTVCLGDTMKWFEFIVRGDSLTKSMSQYLIDQIEATPNIEVRLHTSVVEAKGETSLEELTLVNNLTDDKETVSANSLFIFIGAKPSTEWLDGLLETDERGFILAGSDLKHNGSNRPKGWNLDRDPFLLETNVPGIFAVGDVGHGSVKRVASGVGEGSICVQFVHNYLSKVL